VTVRVATSVSKGWLNEEGGFTFSERYYMDPLYRRDRDMAIDSFLRERFPDHPFYNLESNLAQLEYWKPDFAYVGGIQPNLIVGVGLGARMAWYDTQDIDLADLSPLAHVTSLDELPAPSEILAHPMLQGFDAQIEELRAARPDLTVVPPFFWDTSGRATIHGFVTTSMKLYSEQIFIKMFDEPEFVLGFHDWIADVYIALVRHYSALGDLPVTSVHIGECSGTMVNADQYDEFVVPFVNKVADALGPIRLHSCGRSDHLLETMGHVPKLQTLDTGSRTTVSAVRQQLGSELQLDVAPPLDALSAGASPETMKSWIDEVLVENGDAPILIGYHLEPGYSLANCLMVHEELARRGLTE
jgi:hypothetical protein